MAQFRKRAVCRKKAEVSPRDIAELARACARAADDKKCDGITILDLRQLTYIADFFVIASAGNPRQMLASSHFIQHQMAARGVKPIGVEGGDQSRWILIDFGDVVVHLFEPEWRKLYDLELLWGDAPRLPWKVPVRRRKPTKPKQ